MRTVKAVKQRDSPPVQTAPEVVRGQTHPLPTTMGNLAMGQLLIQRGCARGGSCAACKEEENRTKGLLQRAATGQPSVATAFLQSLLQRSQGQPLESGVRARFEPRFETDFSGVRVHTDTAAGEAATRLAANAVTTGQDIYFAPSRYQPYTTSGQRLLAHELTHTLQQQGQGLEQQVNFQTHSPDDVYDQEADWLADAVMQTPASLFKYDHKDARTSAISVAGKPAVDQPDVTKGYQAQAMTERVVLNGVIRRSLSSIAGVHIQRQGFGEVRLAEARQEEEARKRRAQIAGRLLVISMRTEQLRPLFEGDENLRSQHDFLREHITHVTGLLEQAGQGGLIDPNLLRAAEVGLDLAGLAYDLMRADREATARGIAGVVRSNVNNGLAWTWEGMRELKADPSWPILNPDHVSRVISTAVDRRDRVLTVAPIATVMRAGVTAASIVSGAAGLTRVFASGLPALGRIATWMRGLSIEAGVLELSTGAVVPVFRVVSSAGALELTAAEVVVLAEAGKVSATALNLYMMARGPAGALRGAPTTRQIPGTRGLEHSFDRHAAQWFGRAVRRSNDLPQWQALIERAAQSSQIFEWSTAADITVAHLARIEGKYFVVQFFKTGPRAGELATAFVPSQAELTAMLRLLGL